MVNDPKLLQELLEKLENTPDEIIRQAIDEVLKEDREGEKE